ncbi:hypothetical protein MtrunA17_Chr5g0399021 [Medicago truncatula]|uniref:Transmembrane protein n=1 Tax=Medicago truncatula TaxID=3880 RepID=A0A396HK66_MEDTR|nr:hypothetical protein MtrunA17_Chr5g0399021 [Medicago truncatula]
MSNKRIYFYTNLNKVLGCFSYLLMLVFSLWNQVPSSIIHGIPSEGARKNGLDGS